MKLQFLHDMQRPLKSRPQVTDETSAQYNLMYAQFFK